ncbi:hypothetical protein ACQ86G_21530 [Roseateles chitinivorans]|uniref:hypothetical protein n=1 Tax=Roseateles chitinivorans TaxID=2917965 RepID=UPI003D676DD1
MDAGDAKVIAIGAAVAVVGVLVWKGAGKIGEVLSTDLNPASDKNLAYRGVNGIGSWLSGDPDWSLGTAIYDGLHNADGSLKEGGYDYFGSYWQGLYAGTANSSGSSVATPTPTQAVDEYFKNPSMWGF